MVIDKIAGRINIFVGYLNFITMFRIPLVIITFRKNKDVKRKMYSMSFIQIKLSRPFYTI